MRLLILSGRSGSGKSSALHLLEDEGFTCIDNLPANLLPALIEQIGDRISSEEQRFAIGIDARNIYGDLSKLAELIDSSGIERSEYQIVFLDSSREILLKRFSETRRRHPLSDEFIGLNEAISREKSILQPIAAAADVTIDTSHLSLHELRSAIKHIVVGSDTKGMALMFKSFGYKYGVPVDVDFVFDVRCLPNPYWSTQLRDHTGLEPPVISFLDAENEVEEMYNDILQFVRKWIPHFESNNRSYLTVAIGCTGGWHRSVYMCERLAKTLKGDYTNVQTRHRQLENVPGH
ncbi:RNase adapter RapZ [Teredinibacter haidensis]|uniref:RNase adapter RapZ n=1 Tax=Teredinibacter haidensis TaxID=2731755 RepID=UPI000948C12A|nr:RNase adapter RapZ [Teredinibacter haidensis]